MKKQYHTNIPASYLVLFKGSEVLLLRRANTGFCDGDYSLPAGHVEAGETFTQALTREIKEEVGIVLDPKNVKVEHVMHRKSHTDGSERVDVFFKADKWQGEIENKEPHKCDDLSWFSLEGLPENIIPYIKQALGCIHKKIFFSEAGW